MAAGCSADELRLESPSCSPREAATARVVSCRDAHVHGRTADTLPPEKDGHATHFPDHKSKKTVIVHESNCLNDCFTPQV